MIKKAISKVFIIIAAIACFQLLGTIILARNLTKQEMGMYGLILAIVELGSFVSLMGIDSSFVKFFSSSEISFQEYNWKNFFKKISLISIFLIFIVISMAAVIYKFDLFIVCCVAVLLCMITSIYIFTSFLRAQKKYSLAIFLNRQHFLLYFIFILILYVLGNMSFVNILICYVSAVILSNFIIIRYCLKNIPSGNTALPISILKNGLYFFGIGVSLITIFKINYLFIGKILSYKDLAMYTVIASTMRLFEFGQDAPYHVLVPYLNTKDRISIKKILLLLSLIAFSIAIIYMFFGKVLVHIFFKGLYDEGVYLIPLFIGIGIVRTICVLPASIIDGRGPEDIFRKKFYLTMLTAVMTILISYIFIHRWGLIGAASASLIAWCMFLIINLALIKKYYAN